MPIFRVKSVKIYSGQKEFTRAPPVAPVTNMRYGCDLWHPLCLPMLQQQRLQQIISTNKTRPIYISWKLKSQDLFLATFDLQLLSTTTSVFLYFCNSAHLCFCYSVFLYFCISALLCFCYSVFLYFCISSLLCFCYSVLLYFCISALLCFCYSVFLYFCISALLCSFILYFCTSLIQHFCVSVLCISVLLYFCTSVFL